MEALCIICLTILALASMYFSSKSDDDKDVNDKKKRRTKDEK